jgi:hypothetical protein
MIDRASIVARKVMAIVCEHGLGERAVRVTADILRDEFSAIESEAIQEFRFRPEGEDE